MYKIDSEYKDSISKLYTGTKGATMLEYALLLSLLCVVAVPAVFDLGTNTDETLSEVSESIRDSAGGGAGGLLTGVNVDSPVAATAGEEEVGDNAVGGLAGPPPPVNWNGGPAPFANGTNWHAVDINEQMVLPAHANGDYQIYTVWTSGPYEGSYYMNYFRQNEQTGEWTQYPRGVHPDYSADAMAGASGEWISFYDVVPWLEGSNYPRPAGR
jgi:Flp pilus assembly pilin Flp